MLGNIVKKVIMCHALVDSEKLATACIAGAL